MKIEIDLIHGRVNIAFDSKEFGTDIPLPHQDTPNGIIIAVKAALTDMQKVFSGKTFKEMDKSDDTILTESVSTNDSPQDSSPVDDSPQDDPEGSGNEISVHDSVVVDDIVVKDQVNALHKTNST